LKHLNVKPLSSGGGFWSNHIFVESGKVLALQNVTDVASKIAQENQRHVLSFDTEKWETL